MYKIKLLNVRNLGGSDGKSVAQRKKITGFCALYMAYIGERSWKEIEDRIQAPSYLSRVDHNWKIRARKQRTDVEKYSFVNRTITDWTRLPAGTIGSCPGETAVFKTRGRKGKTSEGK